MSRTKQTKRKIPGGSSNRNKKQLPPAATKNSQAVVVYVSPDLKKTLQLAETDFMNARKACHDAQNACSKAKAVYKKAKQAIAAVTYLQTNTNDALKAIVRAKRIAKKIADDDANVDTNDT